MGTNQPKISDLGMYAIGFSDLISGALICATASTYKRVLGGLAIAERGINRINDTHTKLTRYVGKNPESDVLIQELRSIRWCIRTERALSSALASYPWDN